MAIVYLGIGSNIGNSGANCEEAVRRVSLLEDVEIVDRSSFYLTQPVGGPPQRDYLNGVLKIETGILPERFLAVIKEIESDMGRKTPVEKNLPRVIDIDILLYDDKIIETDKLIVPHPRMHERYFVLHGLNEIASEVVHPVLGKTVRELYRDVVDRS